MNGAGPARARTLAAAVALVSCAAIGYEILLLRLLSIVQWHHFASMVISLALLGYGVSGTLIALTRAHIERRFALFFSLCACALGVTMVACFALAGTM